MYQHNTNIISNFDIPNVNCRHLILTVHKQVIQVTRYRLWLQFSCGKERISQVFSVMLCSNEYVHVPVVLTRFNCACANKNGQDSHSMFFCLSFIRVPNSWRWPLDLYEIYIDLVVTLP